MKSKANNVQLISRGIPPRPASVASVRLGIIASSLWLAVASVQAENKTWNAGSEFWSTAGNWLPATSAAATNDTAHFSAANGNITVRAKDVTVGGIVVNNTGTTTIAGGGTGGAGGNGDFTIGGGGITINAGAGAVALGLSGVPDYYIGTVLLGASQSWINNSSSLLSRVGNRVDRVAIGLGANTLTIGGSGNTTLYHVINGAGGALIKTGAGILTINGGLGTGSEYSGATTVSAGTLLLSSGANINSTSALSIASGGTFTNNSNQAFTKGISLAEGGVLNGSGAFTPTSLSITADLTNGLTAFNLGSASLTKSGSFTLTLSGVTEGTYSFFSGGSVSGSFGSMFIGAAQLTSTGAGNFSGVIGELQFTFTNETNQLVIASTIPEPSTVLLFGASVGAFAVLRRRLGPSVL